MGRISHDAEALRCDVESTQNKLAEPGLSGEVFLNNLSESGLLLKEELAKLPLPDGGADAAAVAGRLVAEGILTRYQADAVRDRKFDELLIGNYEVLDRLGAGGMGTVYKARHRRMKRIVALKVLLKNLAQDQTFVRRFQREVETVARLSHPNIVMAFDADESPAGYFLVMEFVDGQDLYTLVRKHGPLSVADAIQCTLQSARGLQYAHEQGIIHRDIKPANLLRDASGMVKVTDLGLARPNLGVTGDDRGNSGITQAGVVMGTIDYMPPEQAFDAATMDHRADIYSLGCTLHFLLGEEPPYCGSTLMAILLAHREAPIPSLREACEDVPVALDAIFHRMLAKSPADRYQSMSEVVQALEALPSIPSDKPPARPIVASVAPQETSMTLAAGGATIVQAARAPQVLKVLLVEPSRTQSAIIRKYLQGQGVEQVTAVTTGQEALQTARNESPGVIISSLHLSDMTGVQLAQQICAETSSPPGFVLISSEADVSQAGSLSRCGNAILLHKPFTPEKLAEALKVVALKGQAPSAAQRSKLRVLIVDDSAPARRHIRDVLTSLGVSQFAEAADGAQGVAAVARETFDLIVTDYNMPYLDGHGLVGYLRQNPSSASIPIVMVTTEQDPGKLEAVRQLGVTAICDKSFPTDVVRNILDRLVSTP